MRTLIKLGVIVLAALGAQRLYEDGKAKQAAEAASQTNG